MLAFCESGVNAPKELRDSSAETLDLETLFDSFEATYPIAEIVLITNLSPEEALNHPVREPARIALITVVEKLHKLRDKTNISKERYQELHERYKRLSQAVGVINNNKVDHSR